MAEQIVEDDAEYEIDLWVSVKSFNLVRVCHTFILSGRAGVHEHKVRFFSHHAKFPVQVAQLVS